MRFLPIFLWLSAAIAATSSQSASQSALSELPNCASKCVLKYFPATGCSVGDNTCLCANKPFWSNVKECTLPSCTTRELLNATRIGKETCGVPARNKSKELQIIGPTFVGIALLAVVLRVLARRPGVSDLFGWDDGLIILAWCVAIPQCVAQVMMSKTGLGQDIWNVPFDDIDRTFMWYYAAETFYLFATAIIRLSILTFYLRIFVDGTFRRIVYGVMVANVMFAVCFVFPLVFQCSPISSAWRRWDNQVAHKCINIKAGLWSHAGLNILLDLIVLVLPLRQLFRLQIGYSIMKKVHIFVMFSVGLIVTVISILRLRTLIILPTTKNPTWDDLGAAIWSILEVEIGIICACLPHAKLFFTRLVPRWLGWTVNDTSAHSHRYATPQATPGSTNAVSKRQSKLTQSEITISEIPAESEFIELRSTADSRCSVNKDDVGMAH